MGGNDKIYLRGQMPGTTKINGGEGNDTIYITLGLILLYLTKQFSKSQNYNKAKLQHDRF